MSDSDGKRRNLGRGLSALLGDDPDKAETPEAARTQRTVPVELIEPSRVQPRRVFDKEELDSLTLSVREKGILQPLMVRTHPDDPDKFELVAGERRWLAAQAAQLHDVPIILRELSDGDALEIALIENIQRQDLTAVEEAEAYKRLMDEFDHTQQLLSQVVGKSRSHVANTLRLLTLPESVKDLIDSRELTAGHARNLVNADNPEALAKSIVARGLSVRETERLVQGAKGKAAKSGAAETPDDKPADTLALERELASLLGLKVDIKAKGESGSLIISFTNLDQLDDVLQRLSRGSL